MSLEFDITAEDGWHMGERKTFDIRVVDAVNEPVDLTNVAMIWRVARDSQGRHIYLSKETPEANGVEPVAHADDSGGVKSVARCQVEPDDYGLFPRPGLWRHELKNVDNDLVLSFGKARLLPAMAFELTS